VERHVDLGADLISAPTREVNVGGAEHLAEAGPEHAVDIFIQAFGPLEALLVMNFVVAQADGQLILKEVTGQGHGAEANRLGELDGGRSLRGTGGEDEV